MTDLKFSMSALAASIALAFFVVVMPVTAQTPPADPQNTLVIELTGGKVLIRLRSDLAPNHVARVKQLADDGFYKGLKWHRVIDAFMAQSGDPTGTGTSGSKYGPLKAEFTSVVFKRGTVGAARSRDPDSANSQFFICFDDDGCKGLTNKYTIWGEVIEGMPAVDKIIRGEPPAKPDVIVDAYIQAKGKK